MHQVSYKASFAGGGDWIRTSVGVSQQIYSLPPLTTWVPARNAMYEKSIYTMTVNRLHFFIVLMRKEEQTNPRTSSPPYQGRIYAGKCELVLSSKRPILLIKCSEVKSQN